MCISQHEHRAWHTAAEHGFIGGKAGTSPVMLSFFIPVLSLFYYSPTESHGVERDK